jgi:hypothetical protein
MLVILLLTAYCAVLPAPSSAAAPVSSAEPLTGSLQDIHGVRVLRVWGSAFESGYAHGFLLADDIMGMLAAALLDPQLLADPQEYEQKVLPQVCTMMRFDARRTEELDGMVAGIRAARGSKGIRLERLNRDLKRADLEAANTLADWYRLGCSSFSAWGVRTGGQMVMGRNLDFMSLPGMRSQHLVIVYLEPGPGHKKWVSVTWPSLIGTSTAMNEDGVTIAMHDARGRRPVHKGKYCPRSFALRAVIEQAGAPSAVADARRVLLANPTLVGNNIHVCGPYSGQDVPAAVFEYDGDVALGGGLTQRVARDEREHALEDVLLCTNHYRKRGAAQPCNRFATMVDILGGPRADRLGVAEARQVMRAVSVPGTMHTVIFLPNRKELYVSFADESKNATQFEPVKFTLAALFKR